MTISNELYRFLIGLDQAFDPLVYGGSENVTISSMSAYKEALGGKRATFVRKAIDWVALHGFGQRYHCYSSLWHEKYEFDNAAQAVITAYLGAMPAVATFLAITA